MTKLATVTQLYESNSRDIAATLRHLADEIEQAPDQVREVALVSWGAHGLKVYGAGENDAASTHLLLSAGAQKIRQTLLDYESPCAAS